MGVGPLRQQPAVQINEFKAMRKTPCQLHALCPAPNGGIINRDHCAFIKWRPGFWFFSHGGAVPWPPASASCSNLRSRSQGPRPRAQVSGQAELHSS